MTDVLKRANISLCLTFIIFLCGRDAFATSKSVQHVSQIEESYTHELSVDEGPEVANAGYVDFCDNVVGTPHFRYCFCLAMITYDQCALRRDRDLHDLNEDPVCAAEARDRFDVCRAGFPTRPHIPGYD